MKNLRNAECCAMCTFKHFQYNVCTLKNPQPKGTSPKEMRKWFKNHEITIINVCDSFTPGASNS